MDFAHSERTQALVARVSRFMREEIVPAEAAYAAALTGNRDHRRWRQPPIMEALKAKARAEGLWNLFLPDAEHGAGLSNVDYAPLAEIMARVPWASEAVPISTAVSIQLFGSNSWSRPASSTAKISWSPSARR